ncbi:putative quinol monooxygenase [Alloalcanivorax mobilis]|uniref:putative quinol monooxygenase n=1 Tax=Alloalcanivorax mobilis TaxID=2019569 RepID=UPI000B5B1908|nr:putative quinol monooxygenase [Alloalcanivorax mobilis]ASK35100.1 antibiotic biosynthesis monooxygenase [Alcanivorax sp. N3-2A]|tara:strand:- start:14126 stop:14473 length:348 start_codon:yes stop_codon:yes gene_type:complete
MVIVKGVIPVRDATRDKALALIQELASHARDEDGCLSYEVYVKADAPRVIMLWQQWRTLDALERHFDSDHLDLFLDRIPEMIDGEVHSLHFDVSDDEDEGNDPSGMMLADDTVVH